MTALRELAIPVLLAPRVFEQEQPLQPLVQRCAAGSDPLIAELYNARCQPLPEAGAKRTL